MLYDKQVSNCKTKQLVDQPHRMSIVLKLIRANTDKLGC